MLATFRFAESQQWFDFRFLVLVIFFFNLIWIFVFVLLSMKVLLSMSHFENNFCVRFIKSQLDILKNIPAYDKEVSVHNF